MNILIVDDNATNLVLFKALVNKLEGCTPVSFDDPLAALDWSRNHVPDLVLLDFMMPGMDGIDVLRNLRLMPGREDCPVIMVTAAHETDVRHRALEAGANDFLTKPIDKAEFQMRVRNALALRKSRQQLANRAEWLAEEVEKATEGIRKRELEAIILLSRAAEYRDPETGAHIQRMARYSQVIGRKLGLAEETLELLLNAAPMHDIGKVGIPDAILLKPGKLTDEEFAVMKRHAEIGWQILQSETLDNPMLKLAAEIALSHHEKFDGSGYPDGVAGDVIPLVGRIVAVADVFDALTSERPYKPAWSLERTAALLREQSGKHFDPACIDAFFSAWDEIMEIKDAYQDD